MKIAIYGAFGLLGLFLSSYSMIYLSITVIAVAYLIYEYVLEYRDNKRFYTMVKLGYQNMKAKKE